MENSEQSAFPVGNQHSGLLDGGLTKREYFAAMAMQGLLSNPFYAESSFNKNDKIDKVVCARAVELANELLKHLESNPLK